MSGRSANDVVNAANRINSTMNLKTILTVYDINEEYFKNVLQSISDYSHDGWYPKLIMFRR